jgi:hypothetical protein
MNTTSQPQPAEVIRVNPPSSLFAEVVELLRSMRLFGSRKHRA